jgi:hypothetical protein
MHEERRMRILRDKTPRQLLTLMFVAGCLTGFGAAGAVVLVAKLAATATS